MLKIISQFVKFGIVGLSNTIISYIVYAALIYIGMPYLIASITGFVVGVLNSFLWNNLYVFKKNDNEKRNPWLTLTKTFLAYAGTGLVMANILLILFIEKYGISKYVAPLITLLITVPLNFIINKYWSFRIEKKENGET
jgi:putative flippase GtrA